MSETHAEKVCAVCGRRIAWRKKWERDWEGVRYCSEGCRRTKLNEADHALEAAILRLLGERASGVSICPSEAARVVGGEDESAWRGLMERARMAARRLVAQGRVVMMQRGRVVDPSEARGPVRIRLR